MHGNSAAHAEFGDSAAYAQSWIWMLPVTGLTLLWFF
jgi:hypothetical protein